MQRARGASIRAPKKTLTLACALGVFTLGCLPLRAPEPGEQPLNRETLALSQIQPPVWTQSQALRASAPASPQESADGLESLLADIMASNPGLRASWLDFEAALQRIPQVTALDEPMITATIPIEEVQTRTGPQDFALGLQQRFPWFGVLSLQGQVAWQRAQERLQSHLTELLNTVRRAQGLWWEIAFQRSARRIAEEERALLGEFADITLSRYATGLGSQQEVLRAAVEIARVREQLVAIDARIATLTAELNALRSRPGQTPIPIPAISETALQTFAIDVTALLASAEAHRPELAELRHRLERLERERRLARSRLFPRLMVGANWIAVGGRPDDPSMPPSDEGDDAVNVVVGATIPLWWRAYHAGMAEAERSMAATSHRLRATEDRIESEVLAAHHAMGEALDLMELYATALLPQATQTLEATEAGFATGRVDFLDLIDAERVLIRLRLAHERARRDHLLAVADLERAVGAALVDLSRTTLAPSSEESEEDD